MEIKGCAGNDVTHYFSTAKRAPCFSAVSRGAWLGPIIDFHAGGLGFDYLPLRGPLKNLDHISILNGARGFIAVDLPCRIVSITALRHPQSPLGLDLQHVRVCFDGLDRSQQSLIGHFLYRPAAIDRPERG